ncbi:MAG: ABC transporter ATP-binding protein/permease [Spirochaetales bacterium]|nr:ABC transporter ATP-binding protein/permease [Spirochaetales bacterium]
MIHHQDEKIIARYDPALIRRLAAFARPYRRYIAVALTLLLIATVGEVLLPVVIQRTIDREILDFWVGVDPAAVDRFDATDETVRIGDTVYLREEFLDHISRPERDAMRADGTLDPRRFVIVPADAVTTHPAIARKILSERVATDGSRDVYPRAVLDRLERDERLTVRPDNLYGLRRNAVVFFLILVGVLASSFGQVYLTAYTGQLVMKRLRLEVFGHTVGQNLGFLGNQAVGRLVTRATNDVETVNELFTSVLAELTRNISIMIAVVITMLSLNARLAGIVLLSMIPVVVLTDIFRRRARDAFRKARRAVSIVNAYLAEYISGMSIVQMFVQERRSRREFDERNGELLRAHIAEMHVFAVFRPIVDFMATTSTAVVIFFGARLLNADLVSLGVLIAFANLIRRFYMPVMMISEQFTVLQGAMAGAERVFSLLDEHHRIADDGTKTIERSSVRGAIRFDEVRFAYKPNEPVLTGLSFAVEPGQMVAVVGYTGAGKTTIINVLTRLWDIESGSISIDGVDIRTIPLATLRSIVQPIQQDVYLFSDTIRNNITLGESVDDDDVWRACEAVQIADYIRGLPDGLDTVLRERGTDLSAGQRQLVSFARVLIHDPPILLLDEATSNIDSETEDTLQRAVETVTGGRTSLVIAHRLSTIQHADTILVLSHGTLEESGTHAELVERNGLYATLDRLQYMRQGSSEA